MICSVRHRALFLPLSDNKWHSFNVLQMSVIVHQDTGKLPGKETSAIETHVPQAGAGNQLSPIIAYFASM